jgi:hypothetical protein
MEKVDLGEVQVKVTPVPTGKAQPAPQMELRDGVKDGDPALNDMARPKHLPAGMAFADATVVSAPVRMIVSIYYDPDSSRSVMLAQSPVAGLASPAGEKATLFAVGESVDEVTISGEKAAKVTISSASQGRGAKTSVVWRSGENVYQLSGRGTSEAELIEIAASV